MEQRIAKLLELSNVSDIYSAPVHTEYNKEWLLEPTPIANALRFAEYMKHQTVLTEPSLRLPGMFRFDGSFPADIFRRIGYTNFSNVAGSFYLKPHKGIATFEWQHSTVDYGTVLNIGLPGLRKKIEASKKEHSGDKDKLDFLRALEISCGGIEAWCLRIADEFEAKSSEAAPERAAEMLEIARICRELTIMPPRSFRGAVTMMAILFQFLPDSIGLIDRHFYSFYTADLAEGRITRDEAKSLLQELFVIIKAQTVYTSGNYGRGGESHFAIGGYNVNMEDNWNCLSDLILEALLELPMCCPQISIRWTDKMPFERFKHILDCERKDKYKRIAIINDESRIPAYTNILKVPLEEAVAYTTVGCNETAFPGGIDYSGMHSNLWPSITRLTHEKRESFEKCQSFDEVFELFSENMTELIDELIYWQDKFNYARSKDIDVISSLLMKGSIESGVSATGGGAKGYYATISAAGFISIIDSLIVIKQFVFDEKKITASELCNLLDNNWGDGEFRSYVLKHANFFGNNDSLSNDIAMRVNKLIYNILKERRNIFGQHFLLGNMEGYNPHTAWFGALTPATPDGRFNGDGGMIGIGQCDGKDRKGLVPLLMSVAHMDPTHIMTSTLVFNIQLEENLITNDLYFEKTARMLETYLKEGGTQFQLNYVSRETLLAATANPENYGSLRVRVSGFSAYYTRLQPEIQQEILHRTEVGCK